MYTSQQLADIFSVSDESIRQWAARFASFLSGTANPGKKRTRLFDKSDVEVLSLVNELKRRGLTFDEIELNLASGQRGAVPEITPGEMDTLQSTEIQRRLSIQLQGVQIQLEKANEEITRLKSFELENARLLERIVVLTEQITKLETEVGGVGDLREQIGALKAEIRFLQQGRGDK